MTKYLISGYIGFDNFGDEAIAKVLTTYLKNKNPEKITVLSSNPPRTSLLYGVNSVNYLKFLKPILDSDVLISGGGSLLQDVTSLKSLVYYLTVIMTALLFGKRVVIFAQGFTPFKTKVGKILTKHVVRYADAIYVRDSKSKEILQEMGIQSEIVSDPVFGMDVPNNESKNGIGIQLRGFHTLTDDFMKKLAKYISEKFKGEKIKLFSLQDSIDLPVLNKFELMLHEYGIETELYKTLLVEDGVRELSKLEYLISMRFHSSLVAAKAGVKVLGINYDIKVLNLSKNIGFPIIGLNQNSFEEEFEEFINLDISKYNIPEFKFPEFI